ncbi:hypothetical protein HHK36_009841 [Tetracentron sinense]|uniref:F-box protein GID2 n=1 Tax=Tetracentron sinense TaxID=13715 RepID=A0A834ZJQ8_TETSI|nr:hypothetical protein HHK36_009841 [Tetracentron sinense]
MKRSLDADEDPAAGEERMKKKIKGGEEEEEEEEIQEEMGCVYLDDNLLYEVLKHVDAKSLAKAGCVSKQWHKTAEDERLWEMICIRHWASVGCGTQQLRSLVLSLGGFRRLYSLYIRHLLKPFSSPSPSSSSPFPAPGIHSKTRTHGGKDEVHLTLSLLSIGYFKNMNLSNRSQMN